MAYTVNFPAGVANPSPADRAFISDLQALYPHYYPELIQRYGTQNYHMLLESMGLKRVVQGQSFFHFEDYGKLHAACSVASTITAPAAGAPVTFTLSAADHYQSGTESPGRVGESVRIDSSGIEGRIIAKSTTTPNAHTIQVQPAKTSQAFVSAGSANLLAAEVVLFMGGVDIGEKSTQLDGQSNLIETFTNTTTQIREDWSATDLAMIERLEFEVDGNYYYTYKGIKDMTQRFLNYKEFKLMRGDVANNYGSYGGSVGTQGLLPRINSDGQITTYTPTQLNVSQLHNIFRGFDFYGGAQEYHWLMDSYQYTEVMDQLFALYSGGAVVWDYAGGSPEAAAAYGFKSIYMDGYTVHMDKYLNFNSESVWGKASTNSQFRNYGLLIPMKQWTDPVRHVQIPTLSIVVNQLPGKPEIISMEDGLAAKVPTNPKAYLNVTNLTYAAIEVFAANQYMIVEG